MCYYNFKIVHFLQRFCKRGVNKNQKGAAMGKFVELKDVRKIYHMGEVEIAAANGISFYIEK